MQEERQHQQEPAPLDMAFDGCVVLAKPVDPSRLSRPCRCEPGRTRRGPLSGPQEWPEDRRDDPPDAGVRRKSSHLGHPREEIPQVVAAYVLRVRDLEDQVLDFLVRRNGRCDGEPIFLDTRSDSIEVDNRPPETIRAACDLGR